ncbi:MAG: type II toxin-antitoxin system RelE/ParE family toxin [Candidatus Aenigmarchaeota archaeon]|nr:type II toxin-antitoxin system RelE/ParE family toxin [Candidatus Aenigmarchaeota archaeon]
MRKLEHILARRIFLKIESLKESPHIFVSRLAGDNGYKLRVGDYRVILDIEESKREIFVRLVDHRSVVYKKLRRN